MTSENRSRQLVAARILAAGGEAGLAVAGADWASTELGPTSDWPDSVWTAVSVCLCADRPMLMLLGAKLHLIINDSMSARLVERRLRPGDRATGLWRDAAAELREVADRVRSSGQPALTPPLQLLDGVVECSTVFSLSAISDGSGATFGLMALPVMTATDGSPAGTRLAMLQSRVDELEAEIRSREDLLLMATHDLRSPLTTLSLQAGQLARQLGDERVAPAKLAERVIVIQRQVERLTAQLDRLRDFSQLQAGALELRSEVVELPVLLGEIVEQLELQAKQRGAPISLIITDSIEGQWDRLRLEQIFTNLIVNALKYGRGRPVQVLVERAGDDVVVAVSDNGEGIPTTKLDAIFRQFTRVSETTRTSGLGLGLYIAQGLVKAMGGRIGVESRRGEGTTFRVVLPLSSRADRAHSSSS